MKKAFESLKRVLATPLILTRPLPEENLYLYLAFLDVVSVVYVRGSNSNQSLVYFISKTLLAPETRY